MRTVLSAAGLLLAVSAPAAQALQVEDVAAAAPVAPGPFSVAYSAADDRLIAFNGDFSASIDALIDGDGAIVAATPLDLLVSDPASFADAAFGTLADVRLSDGLIELLFEVSDEDPADGADWGPYALASFAVAGFDAALGLDQLDDGGFLAAEGSVASAAAVPLPATLPLLAAAAALLVGASRRRAG